MSTQGSTFDEPVPTLAVTLPVRRSAIRRFLAKPLGVTAAAILIVIILASLLAPVLTPFAPDSASLKDAFGAPSGAHWLGFDSAGRDIVSRLLYGGQNTLGGAVIALAVALAIALPSGLLAGYYGGWFDATAGWLVNLLMALPAMVVLLASRAIIGPTVWVLMVVMGVLVSPSIYRLIRNTVRQVRHELYVDAAVVSGLSDWRIIGRHIAIVVRAPIIIQIALVAGVAIGLQAGLEFLGIGSGEAPTWGAMLNEAFQNVQRAPLMLLWPGLALGLTSASLVLVASSLRDTLEERASAGKATKAEKKTQVAPSENSAAPATPSPESHARGDLISVRDLVVSYTLVDGSERDVVRGVNLDVNRGEVLGLVGESGSGKTQTAFSILGILPTGGRITGGSALVSGTEVASAAENQHAKLRGTVVAYIPQEPMSNLDPAFTVGDQLVEVLRVVGKRSKREARTRALELLAAVEIPNPEEVFAKYPHQISGGMAQRVLIASAISCEPSVLIADEPTTALDVTVQAEILNILRRLRDERGMGILLVTHNLAVVADLCDRVAVMREGRIVETGDVRQVLQHPQNPYTQRLLSAVLDGDPPRGQRNSREVTS